MNEQMIPMLDAKLSTGVKFGPEDVFPVIAKFAYEYAENYVGSFAFMLDMRDRMKRGFPMSNKQLAAIMNCAMAQRRRMITTIEANEELGHVPEPVVLAPVTSAPTGIFTVDIDGRKVTVRLEKPNFGTFDDGTLIAKYLVHGPRKSDRRDWYGFAFVNQNRAIKVWNRQKDVTTIPQTALKMILTAADPCEYGYAYALMSGRCWVCNKELSDPVSVKSGIGPECAKNRGINRDKLNSDERFVANVVKELVIESRVG